MAIILKDLCIKQCSLEVKKSAKLEGYIQCTMSDMTLLLGLRLTIETRYDRRLLKFNEYLLTFINLYFFDPTFI
jgi:hypothetical protein